MKYRRHHTGLSKIILWGSVLGIVYISQQSLITVQNVECHLQNNQDCPPYITKELESLKGKQLLFNTFTDQLAQLQFDQPAQVRLKSKSLPHTIVVEASIDPGLYRLQDSNLVITAKGETFANEQSNLPVVELPVEDNGSESLLTDYHPSLKTIFESFAQQGLDIQKISWYSDQNIQIKLASGLVVITDVDTATITAQKTNLILQAQINQNIQWEQKELDVRFRLPVLRNRT